MLAAVAVESPAPSYADLRQQARDMGLLRRSGWNYAPLLLGTVVLIAVGLALGTLAPFPWALLGVPLLVVGLFQVGAMGHEAGHNQIFEQSGRNRLAGMLALALVLGSSYRRWVIKHNLHHASTNVDGVDPDLENPLLAFTEEVARSRRGFARWVVRHQGRLYPVLGLFATISFRLDGWRYALGLEGPPPGGGRYERERRVEVVLLSANALLWMALPLALVGWRWLPFFVLTQMLLGFHLSTVFAPNHKGMPLYDAEAMPGFIEAQVLTSRNVGGGPLVDYMYGGLNYQIEHHLFPTMPRKHLAKARDLVRAHCRRIGLAYEEDGVARAWRRTLESLDEIGRMVDAPGPVASVRG